jgi:integrase
MSIEKRPNGYLARPFIDGKRVSRFFPTKREALEWERTEKTAREKSGKPLGNGPDKTSLAEAMAMFAERETKYKKGWKQELNRINKWRDVAGLPRLVRTEVSEGETIIEPAASDTPLPRTFCEFRDKRLSKSRKADLVRAKLSQIPLSAIATHDLQDLQNAMCDGGLKPDTIRLEMALLKRIFNVSRDTWNWRYQAFPFNKYTMPGPGEGRNHRIPVEKEAALLEQLAKCRSPFILPYVLLAIETTMRRGEVLFTATWNDVDLAGRTIRLYTDKAGLGRDVPLSKAAVTILEKLPRPPEEKRIFPISPDQLQAAWRKACQRAGISNLRIHDLRHEGASRYALRMKGNIFLLKKITGHRSTKMLERYINITKEELLNEMDASEIKLPGAPSMPASAAQVENNQTAEQPHSIQAPANPPLRLVAGSRR